MHLLLWIQRSLSERSLSERSLQRQRKHLIFIGIIQAMEVITLQSREKAL